MTEERKVFIPAPLWMAAPPGTEAARREAGPQIQVQPVTVGAAGAAAPIQYGPPADSKSRTFSLGGGFSLAVHNPHQPVRTSTQIAARNERLNQQEAMDIDEDVSNWYDDQMTLRAEEAERRERVMQGERKRGLQGIRDNSLAAVARADQLASIQQTAQAAAARPLWSRRDLFGAAAAQAAQAEADAQRGLQIPERFSFEFDQEQVLPTPSRPAASGTARRSAGAGAGAGAGSGRGQQGQSVTRGFFR